VRLPASVAFCHRRHLLSGSCFTSQLEALVELTDLLDVPVLSQGAIQVGGTPKRGPAEERRVEGLGTLVSGLVDDAALGERQA
jgi:hypothetical protein